MSNYFVNPNVSRSEAPDGVGRYWRAQTYEGWGSIGDTYAAVSGTDRPHRFRFQVNLSLLATICGDTPIAPPGSTLVEAIDYAVSHREEPGAANESTTIKVQPWEAISATGELQQLPIGKNLAKFLDDPLNVGGGLGLGLPIMDPEATVSHCWIRSGKNPFHGGFDFSVLVNAWELRPLIDACAAAEGTVWMLLKDTGHSGGVVLRHEPAPGLTYATLYQHLQPDTVTVAVGDRVRRGERLGRIRRYLSTNEERTHTHFNLLVRAPGPVAGIDSTHRLWFAIDPFGVYDEHSPDGNIDYVYIPRPRGGMMKPIRGAERTIHWAGNPPIEAFSGELHTPFTHIRELQMRSRTHADASEMAQMLVWLEGDSERYHVKLGIELDREIEEALCALLRDAYSYGKRLQLGYRFRSSRREVVAAWVRH